MIPHQLKTLLTLVLLIILCTLSSCAEVEHPSGNDPYESFNRAMFTFNRELDKDIIKPLAEVYNAIIPSKAQKHIGYFFDNIALLPSMANNILQANLTQAITDGSRFCINSTLGLFGFFDAAKTFQLNLPDHDKQDLGLTLAKYGVEEAPYVMLPLFGPKTLREALTMPISMSVLSPLSYIESSTVSYSIQGVQIMNQRTALLPADKLVDEAFDPYVFVRNAYLQNRNNTIKKMLRGSVTSTDSLDDDDDHYIDDYEDDEDTFLEDLEDDSFLISYQNYHSHYHPINHFNHRTKE